MPHSNSNNQVNIKITESSGPPPSVKIELDNEPFNLSGLGTGTPPQTGAPIQWVIDPSSAAGWGFSSSNGVQIKSSGSNFVDAGLSSGNSRYIWNRNYADGGYYAYSISLTKTVSGTGTQTVIIDPTIINEP